MGLLNAISNVLLEMSQDGEDEDGEVATDTDAHTYMRTHTHTRPRADVRIRRGGRSLQSRSCSAT